LKLAKEQKDKPAIDKAQNELNALLLFQSNMGAFHRLYAYLSQIFNYGNIEIAKRFDFLQAGPLATRFWSRARESRFIESRAHPLQLEELGNSIVRGAAKWFVPGGRGSCRSKAKLGRSLALPSVLLGR